MYADGGRSPSRCPSCTGMIVWTRTRCSPRKDRTYCRSPGGRPGRNGDRRRADGGNPDSYMRPHVLRPMHSRHRSSGSGAHGDRSSSRSRSDALGSMRGAGDLCDNVGTPARIRRSAVTRRTRSVAPSQTPMGTQGPSPGMRRSLRASSPRRRDAVPLQTGTHARKPGAARAPAGDRPRPWKGTPNDRR